MFGITDYGTFIATILLFLLGPGPGNLALITSTTKGGIKGGFGSIFGVLVGDQILMWLAIGGMAAVMAAYPQAFSAVQWIGAGLSSRPSSIRMCRPCCTVPGKNAPWPTKSATKRLFGWWYRL